METDPHTGLLTSQAWFAALKAEIEGAEASEAPFSLTVALIDVDNMARVNAEQGTDAGDRLLVEIADVLRKTCRPTDFVCRWGGEEFGLILRDRSRTQTEALLVRLHKGVTAKHPCDFSIAYWVRGESAERVLERADF